MIKLTDQYFTYREYPLDYDGAGKVYLKGNSIGWNQLAPTLASGNYTANRSTIAYSNNIATVTTNGNNAFGFYRSMATVVGHKYLFTAKVKPSKVGSLRLGLDEDTDVSNRISFTSTDEKTVSRTWTCATANSPLVCYYYNNSIASGDNFTITNLMVIDLTLLNDSHITDLASFKTYFPLSYYSYNQGTLLNFNGTGIKTVGKNFVQLTNGVTRNGITFTNNGDGSVTMDGTATADAQWSIAIPPSTLIGGNYYFSGAPYQPDDSVSNMYVWDDTTNSRAKKWDRTTNVGNVYTNTQNGELYIDPTHQYQLTIRVRQGKTVTNLTYQPMIRFADVEDSTFEPYKETTTDLPILTYFPNGMKSAGSVYDEITGSKAITRVGSVDLGTLTWTYSTTYQRFQSTSLSGSITRTGNSPNVLCPLYTQSSAIWSANTTDKIMSNNESGMIAIRNLAYTDPVAFKSAMSGVYLNYELSSYSETEVNDDFIYLGYADGTEQLLPINGATPTTSPLFADIEYYTLMDSEIPYRKFWIINNSNEQWDLTEKDFKAFLNNPTGLGFKKTIEMTRYGEKAVKNNETYDFPSVQGELLFYDSANSNRYDKYNQFVRFVMDTPLKLYYQIPVSISSQIADIYSMDCEITQLDKTESKPDRLMRCNVTFSGLGFWEGDEVTISGSGLSYTIENKGDFPVGFEIAFDGNFSNPYFTLSQDGEIYGECKFDDSQNTFSNVYVNSNDGEQDIVLKQSGTILPNPLSYQDLSISNGNIYVTFVKLARGTTQLTIGAGTVQTNAEIKFTPAYRSV